MRQFGHLHTFAVAAVKCPVPAVLDLGFGIGDEPFDRI
jgi:hypothetical protein